MKNISPAIKLKKLQYYPIDRIASQMTLVIFTNCTLLFESTESIQSPYGEIQISTICLL